MKKISLKSLKGQSPKKDNQRPPSVNTDPPSQTGSDASKICSLPSPCGQNSFCCPCFRPEQCSCCISFQNECSLVVKRKAKTGIFNTIRNKLSSPKHKELTLWDDHKLPHTESSSSNSATNFCSQTLGRRCKNDDSVQKKSHYRSRSMERPRQVTSDETLKHAGSRSVQLHKKKMAFTLRSSDSKKCDVKQIESKYLHRHKSETDSEDSQIDESRPKDILPFDGYGHATALSCEANENNELDDDDPVEIDTCSPKEVTTSCGSRILMTVPAVQPFYDQVKDPMKSSWSLTKELQKLSRQGWYWGPINRNEAEIKLLNQPDGAFLVRDSSDEHYLLSLSFRSYGRTLHTRIEHCNGVFSFYAQPESEGFCSIVDLIEHSMSDSQTGVFCYSRARTPGSPSFPVRLTKPVSRFTQVRTLQYLCRFIIRQTTRVDHIQRLPLPSSIRGWLQQNQY